MYSVGFDKNGWEDYCHWKNQDKKTIKKIDELIKELFKNPFVGIGKPEPLKQNLTGFWSRRIDEKNRVVYKIEKNNVTVIRCRGHYN
ncbi:MAG: Txe/YoeB family addiction module toxin [bacterium]